MGLFNKIVNGINSANAEAVRENRQQEASGEEIGIFEKIGNFFEDGVYDIRDKFGQVGAYERMANNKIGLDAQLDKIQEESIAISNARSALLNQSFDSEPSADISQISDEFEQIRNAMIEKFNTEEYKNIRNDDDDIDDTFKFFN